MGFVLSEIEETMSLEHFWLVLNTNDKLFGLRVMTEWRVDEKIGDSHERDILEKDSDPGQCSVHCAP